MITRRYVELILFTLICLFWTYIVLSVSGCITPDKTYYTNSDNIVFDLDSDGGKYTYTQPLKQGVNDFTIEAEDKAGNKTTYLVRIYNRAYETQKEVSNIP
jgi:hypothetical protein